MIMLILEKLIFQLKNDNVNFEKINISSFYIFAKYISTYERLVTLTCKNIL